MKRPTAGFIVACGLALVAPCVAHAAVTIKQLEFTFNTKADGKKMGEGVNIQVLKNDTVVYDSGWVQGDVTYNANTTHNWFAPWAGVSIKVPLSTADCSSLKLRVEKQGDTGWTTNLRVMGNERTLVLMTDTPDVQFGKRSAAEVKEVLDGSNGVKFQHANGGNYHVFSFTCKS